MSFFSVQQNNKFTVDPTTIGSADLLITETPADAEAANVAGFPSVAFSNNFGSFVKKLKPVPRYRV